MKIVIGLLFNLLEAELYDDDFKCSQERWFHFLFPEPPEGPGLYNYLFGDYIWDLKNKCVAEYYKWKSEKDRKQRMEPDCWYACHEKGGQCPDFCGKDQEDIKYHAYCCSGSIENQSLNGDCPPEAIIESKTRTELKYHACRVVDRVADAAMIDEYPVQTLDERQMNMRNYSLYDYNGDCQVRFIIMSHDS